MAVSVSSWETLKLEMLRGYLFKIVFKCAMHSQRPTTFLDNVHKSPVETLKRRKILQIGLPYSQKGFKLGRHDVQTAQTESETLTGTI